MILQPHQLHWKDEFTQLKQIYQETLGHLIIAVEHVGSTSVPDLLAKPILDIDIVIAGYEVFPPVLASLQALGYVHNGNQGIPEREAFKRKSEHVPMTTLPRLWLNHHLYVCPVGSHELKRHILFRQALRRSQARREEYQKLKSNVAEKAHGDAKVYAHLKQEACSAFIEDILAAEQVIEVT